MRDEPDEQREIRRTFEKLVNMTPRELEDWLRTP